MPAPSHGDRTRRDRRTWFLLLPFAFAISVMAFVGWRTWEARQAQISAYDRATAALADGNLPVAIAQFGEAGDFRDAREQRITTQQLLAPYQAAYLDAHVAMAAGENYRAVELLRAVVLAMPENTDAALLLHDAEARFRSDLEREISVATTKRDWLAVERAILHLAYLTGESPVEESLTALRLDHAPLLFTRNGALYQVGPDGADQRLLFDQVPVFTPLWSPDRSKIAFFSVVDGSEHFAALFVVDVSGANLLLVDAEAIRTPVAWSPDGSRLAYIGSEALDRTSLVIFELISERSRTVAAPDGFEGFTSPSWAKDGERLAAIGLGAHGKHAILTIDTVSMEATSLLNSTPENARAVSWSPAADTLLLWTSTGDSDWYAIRGSAIYLVDIADRSIVPVTPQTQAPSRPVWSPDGAAYAYLARGGTLHIRVPTGIGERTLELPHKGDGIISWSPGGEGIAIPPLDLADPVMIVPVRHRLGPVELMALRFEDGWPATDLLWSPSTAPDPALYDPFRETTID